MPLTPRQRAALAVKQANTRLEPRKGFSEATKRLLEGRKGLKVCSACNGTGLNSNGSSCYPCLVRDNGE